MRSIFRQISVVSAGLLAMIGASQAEATLYAADNTTGGTLFGVVQFNNNLGVTGSFTTMGAITGLATNGTNIFASLPNGITQFTPAGTVVRTYANVGVDHFFSLATAGTNLLAVDNTTSSGLQGIVTFNSNLQVTSSFTTATPISGLATDGTSIYASLTNGIYKYSMTGAILASYANVGVDRFYSLSFANNILYAADNTTSAGLNGVVKFDPFFNIAGTFLTSGPIAGLAADGTNVYASLPTGISEYTNAGVVVRSYNNIGIDSFGALALTPAATAAVPEPATWAMMLIGFGLAGAATRRRSRVGQGGPAAG